MEEIEHPNTDRTTLPRVSQACQRCRSLKTRCLPSELSGTCQRCFTSKRECIWAETPRRPRRVRGPSRISQVEQKIDGLVASLVNSDTSRPSKTPTSEVRSARTGDSLQPEKTPKDPVDPVSSLNRPLAPGSWLPFPASFERHHSNSDQSIDTSQQDEEPTQQYLEKLREVHNFSDNVDLSRPPPDGIFHGSQTTEPPIESEVVQNILATEAADALLNEYRSMSIAFPFVPLAPTLSAWELHNTKPMLFLAIICVASWKDHQRQLLLDEVYRTELAHRTIIRPRKTLSLLQSILVYLSRYHFIFSHRTQQIYSLQQLATGLALDIGLHRKSTRPPLDIPGRPRPPMPSTEEQLERHRTLLGCYYLSSVISSGLQKPNLLKHTMYIAECGSALHQHREYPSDAVISHLIALRRLDDQMHDWFFTEETIDLPLTDPRILMNFRFTETQFEEWRRVRWDDEFQRVLDLSSSVTDILLHSIALRSPNPSNQPPVADPTQFNALLATLEACKRFFDVLLALPASDYHLIPFPDWMRLPYAVITLARLCIPSDAHVAAQWDVKTAYERARLDLYLESLCYRMHNLSTFHKVNQPHIDFYYVLKMIMDLTKGWFLRKIHPKKTNTAQAASAGPSTGDTMSTYLGSTDGDISGSATQGSTDHFQGMMGGMGFESNRSVHDDDPFAFMKDIDFDMDKFFDTGLWGDDAYVGMGFGGGKRF